MRPYLLGRNARLTKKAALELAAVAQVNPTEAQKTFEQIQTVPPPISIAPHLKLTAGALVEISTPNNPKIHERYGRIAAVHESRVEVWVRDTEMMEMNKYPLKFNQVEAVALEKEPQLAEICQRLERLRKLALDPFERDVLNLLERSVVLTPTEMKYLSRVEQDHGLS
ncbi:MAG: hypothetical protein ACRDEA_01315 [Microcystaceae cyanobacterium]